MRSHAVLLLASLGLATASEAVGQDWEVNLTPYVWVAFPRGDVSVAGSGPGGGGGGGVNLPQINANFDDVKLSGIFTGSADVSYRRFGLFGDISYYQIKADKEITVGRLPAISGGLKLSGTKAMLVGYWRAYETEATRVDLLAGAHYLRAKGTATVVTNIGSVAGSSERELWDPIVGIRGETRFGEHLGVKGLASYGGFSGDSDELYELQGYLTWRFNPTVTALAGYRYYSTEWEARFLNYDAAFSGPLVGLNFRF